MSLNTSEKSWTLGVKKRLWIKNGCDSQSSRFEKLKAHFFHPKISKPFFPKISFPHFFPGVLEPFFFRSPMARAFLTVRPSLRPRPSGPSGPWLGRGAVTEVDVMPAAIDVGVRRGVTSASVAGTVFSLNPPKQNQWQTGNCFVF